MYIPSMGRCNFRTNRVALHFCDVTLSAKKPQNKAYPKILKTIGDHLRKRRLDLILYQNDVANIIGVDTNSITNWEKNRNRPGLYLLPKVFEFLGYDPFPVLAMSFTEKLKEYRRKNGLSIRKFAQILGVDPTTLTRWERGNVEPKGKLKERVNLFLRNLTK
jgi:transcriptional regulator with XRE-family HTH domain